MLTYFVARTLEPVTQRALEQFLEEGGGLVALHGSSASFKGSEPWRRILGGWFVGHLQWTHPLKVSIVDRSHPVTSGVADFEPIDEEYCHELTGGVERHILAKFAAHPRVTLSEWSGGNDVDAPGRTGPGMYNSLGHDAASWKHPAWQ